jgi:hypothetical protein
MTIRNQLLIRFYSKVLTFRVQRMSNNCLE